MYFSCPTHELGVPYTHSHVGLAEKANEIIKIGLNKASSRLNDEHVNKWNFMLPQVTMLYNVSYHSTIQTTPYYKTFGVHSRSIYKNLHPIGCGVTNLFVKGTYKNTMKIESHSEYLYYLGMDGSTYLLNQHYCLNLQGKVIGPVTDLVFHHRRSYLEEHANNGRRHIVDDESSTQEDESEDNISTCSSIESVTICPNSANIAPIEEDIIQDELIQEPNEQKQETINEITDRVYYEMLNNANNNYTTTRTDIDPDQIRIQAKRKASTIHRKQKGNRRNIHR